MEYNKNEIYTCIKCGKEFKFKEKRTWKNRVDRDYGFDLCGHCLSAKIQYHPEKHVDTVCIRCGEPVKLESTDVSYRKNVNAPLDLCRNCLQSKRRIEYFANMTEEEKEAFKERKKLEWDEEAKLAAVKRGKDRFANMTEEEKLAYANSKREHWKNLSEEGKQAFIDSVNKSWTAERRQKHSETMTIANKKRWENATSEDHRRHILRIKQGWKNRSEEEMKAWSIFISKKSKKYWDTISDEEFDRWAFNHVSGISKSEISRGPTEKAFANDLLMHDISFEWGYVNQEKHKDFHKLFPYNPITYSRVSPYHAWDFKVGNVLIDIDGNEHILDFERKYPNGKSVNMKEIHQFNDVQRRYQTDGMDAYIILAYNDKIRRDTSVYSVREDIYLLYTDFINLLIYLNKEIKKGS